MEIDWDVLRATLECQYKAWLLSRDVPEQQENIEELIILPIEKITKQEQIAAVSLFMAKTKSSFTPAQTIKIYYGNHTANTDETSNLQSTVIRLSRFERQAGKLLDITRSIVDNNEPPAFYRNPHCPECQFRNSCYKKLKERDCISQLGGISQKAIDKFHKRGIFSITQLSYTFRPRRRAGKPQVSGNFLWELKALAIREQKTFVIQPPNLNESPAIIYLDFEGLPEEKWVYLLGAVIKKEGKPDETISYWSDNKEEERESFSKLFNILQQYPDAPIYHYGSYENKTMKQAVRRWAGRLKREFPNIEKRMVNLLGYLRTHVYPPTYTNGLKELGGFLGFNWSDDKADGLHSIMWRKEWETSHEDIWKEKLIQYNLEDCLALEKVHFWFRQLSINAEVENVQQVREMKKESPYKFHDNPEFGEDFQFINKAAYFDYQRTKIYWRNQRKRKQTSSLKDYNRLNRPGKGKVAWKPKKANEVVIAPPLKECPRCSNKKLYHLSKKTTVVRQTDLKFTPSGVKQWVTEYQSASVKCARCNLKLNNRNLRMMHYGSNLFAWAINLYVRYYISHEMIARLLWEQFNIWISPMYLIMRKNKWWKKFKPEVEYLWEIIKSSPVIHIDETTVKLSKDRGYVWAFATPHTVFYHFTLSRESDFLHKWLKEYKGIIITDFFPGYESIPVKQQRCLVHLIRDLNDDLFKNPFDEEYKELVSEFGKLLRKIIDTIDRFGLRKSHLQKHIKEVERFHKQMMECNYKSDLAIKCSKRLRKHWDELWTFLNYDDVPWNNNNAEAAIKAFAQYRRGVNGQINEKGLQEYLEMLSIAQTCRYRSISFLGYLRHKIGITENINPHNLPAFLPFEQARIYIHKLRFERKNEWVNWKQSGKRPAFIPSSPEKVYKDEGWKSWHDWLGFSFLLFTEARTYMRRLGLKNRDEYWAWLRSRKRPKFIPYSPEEIYKGAGWKNLGDWLGTGNLGRQKKDKLSYSQAKAYVQALGLKTQEVFVKWRKSGQRPETVPANPPTAYKDEFEGWGKFLGTDRVANQNKKYRSYDEAKAFLKNLNISSASHFRKLYKLGAIPDDIPRSPWSYYKRQGTWISYPDLWGNEIQLIK